jgi:hypothetical protein
VSKNGSYQTVLIKVLKQNRIIKIFLPLFLRKMNIGLRLKTSTSKKVPDKSSFLSILL